MSPRDYVSAEPVSRPFSDAVSSGIISERTKDGIKQLVYYYHENFLSRDLETSRKLAIELRQLFPNIDLSENLNDLSPQNLSRILSPNYCDLTYNDARNSMISLFAPDHQYLEDLKLVDFHDKGSQPINQEALSLQQLRIRSGANTIFMQLMRLKGGVMTSHVQERYSAAPRRAIS